MDNLTPVINKSNVQSVRQQIEQKLAYQPYYATVKDATSILTDMDHFPYTRYFRGVYNSPQPVVFEREAGWRPTHNNCYNVNVNLADNPYPDHCFEAACSTVYPCYPDFLRKFSDREAMNVMVNNRCIVQYR